MKFLSIYTGGGGLDIGFEAAGFQQIGGTDSEDLCQQTYKLNRPTLPFKTGRAKDYSKSYFSEFISVQELNTFDCLVGGPPCPAFSKSRFYRKEKPRALDDDIADETINGYLRVLEDFSPNYFVLENVKGLTYKVHSTALEYILGHAERLGYCVDVWKLNAADFGVPQIRERAFVVGSKFGNVAKPTQTHFKVGKDNCELINQPKWKTAGDAISDLPTNGIEEIQGHFAGGKHHNLLKDIPPGENYLFFTSERGHPNPLFKWRSRYWSFLLKLSPDLPSWTIQARRSNNMGPLHWNNRILTVDEIKRLQTFPDDWKLAGSIEQQWRQVGNAVPCLLAKEVASAIIEHENNRLKVLDDNKRQNVTLS